MLRESLRTKNASVKSLLNVCLKAQYPDYATWVQLSGVYKEEEEYLTAV